MFLTQLVVGGIIILGNPQKERDNDQDDPENDTDATTTMISTHSQQAPFAPPYCQ
jgi:hypothetical protein